MKLVKLLAIVFLGSMIAWSCGDDGAPEVTIASPANGTTYAPGDTISFDVTATDDIGVASISVNSELIVPSSQDNFADPLNARLLGDIPLDPSTPAGDYTLTFTAFDDDNNSGEAVVDITIQ